jgi:hypothetical protein
VRLGLVRLKNAVRGNVIRGNIVWGEVIWGKGNQADFGEKSFREKSFGELPLYHSSLPPTCNTSAVAVGKCTYSRKGALKML